MLKKSFIFLIRAGVGFYFIYPAVARLIDAHGNMPVLSQTIYACFSNYIPSVSSDFVWMTWNIFFIVLGLMIAFWKRPLSWIIFGTLLLVLKLLTSETLSYRLLLEIIPVLLVTIALGIYFGKHHQNN